LASKKEKYLESAQRFMLKGQLDKAIKDYQQVVALEPKEIRWRQKLAELLVRDSRKEEAIAQYEDIGKHYAENSYFLKAIAVYKQIQRLSPGDTRIALTVASLNHKQGLIGNAMAEYGQVVAQLEKEGNQQEALKVLEEMLTVDGQHVATRLKHAELLLATGAQDAAYQAFSALRGSLKGSDPAAAGELAARISQLFPGKPEREPDQLSAHLPAGAPDAAPASPKERAVGEWEQVASPKGDASLKQANPPQSGSLPAGAAATLAAEPTELPDPFAAPWQPEPPAPAPAAAAAAGAAAELRLPWEEEIKLDLDDDLPSFGQPEQGGVELPLDFSLPLDLEGTAAPSAVPEEVTPAGEPAFGDLASFSEDPAQSAVPAEAPATSEVSAGEPPSFGDLSAFAEASPFAGESSPFAAASSINDLSCFGDASPDQAEPQDLLPLELEDETPLMEFDLPEVGELFSEGSAKGDEPAEAEQPVAALVEAEQAEEPATEVGQVEVPAAEAAPEPVQRQLRGWEEIFPEAAGSEPAALDLDELESHYDLGIGYKEMGMYGQAIKELAVAAGNPERRLACLTLQAICLREKGEPDQAQALLELGLELEVLSAEERNSLSYELAHLLEGSGAVDEAIGLYREVMQVDAGFRDVAERLAQLTGEETLEAIELELDEADL